MCIIARSTTSGPATGLTLCIPPSKYKPKEEICGPGLRQVHVHAPVCVLYLFTLFTDVHGNVSPRLHRHSSVVLLIRRRLD